MLTKADKFLIAILLGLAVGGIGLSIGYFSQSAGGDKVAKITVDDQLIRTVPLRPGYQETFRLGGATGYNIVEVDNGRIRMSEADCPDQICIRTGWISSPRQQVVCLPHKAVIKIEAVTPADIDDIAR